jgi:hypothetical protein
MAAMSDDDSSDSEKKSPMGGKRLRGDASFADLTINPQDRPSTRQRTNKEITEAELVNLRMQRDAMENEMTARVGVDFDENALLEIQKINRVIDEKEYELAALQVQDDKVASEEEQRLATLERRNAQLAQEANRLQEQLQQARSIQNVVEDDLQRTQDTQDITMKAAALNTQQLTSLRRTAEALGRTTLENQEKMIPQIYQETEGRVNALLEANAALEQQLAGLEQARKGLETQRDFSQEALEQQRQAFGEFEGRTAAELKSLRKDLKRERALAGKTQTEVVQVLNDDIQRKDQELAGFRARLQEATLEKQDLDAKIRNADAVLKAATDAKNMVDTQLNNVYQENEALREQTAMLQGQQTSTEQDFRASIASLQAKIKRDNAIASQDYARLRDANTGLAAKVAKLKEQAKAANAKVSTGTEAVKKNSSKRREVEKLLAIANARIGRFTESLEALRANPNEVATSGPLAGFMYSSSDEEERRRPRRQSNDPDDAVVAAPSSRITNVTDDAPVAVTTTTTTLGSTSVRKSREWVRPPPPLRRGGREEIFDINNFEPKIPEQLAAWSAKLDGVTKAIEIGAPDNVYRKVKALLTEDHPNETEFYHRFYTFVGLVEGACAKSKGTFWKSKDVDLEHMAKDIADATVTDIVTIPISEAEFFPLSKDELALGIAGALEEYRRADKRGVRIEVDPPTDSLWTPQELEKDTDFRARVEKRQEQEFNTRIREWRKEAQGSGPQDPNKEKREAAERNQQRYAKRSSNAPLVGFSQRWQESKVDDRLDPDKIVLFNYEGALIIPYNFWYFLQDKIISKLNTGHSNYTVELKSMTDHAWTNIPAGHTINDIAQNLADGLWDKLQIRSVDGSLKRRPSLFSVKTFLNDIAAKRVINQINYINDSYNQVWQDKLTSMLQVVVDPNVFNAFNTALGSLGRRFDIYDERLNGLLQNITFANLVGAIYQKNVVDSRVGVTGLQLRSAAAKVSSLLDAVKRTLSLSTSTEFRAPPPLSSSDLYGEMDQFSNQNVYSLNPFDL